MVKPQNTTTSTMNFIVLNDDHQIKLETNKLKNIILLTVINYLQILFCIWTNFFDCTSENSSDQTNFLFFYDQFLLETSFNNTQSWLGNNCDKNVITATTSSYNAIELNISIKTDILKNVEIFAFLPRRGAAKKKTEIA